MEYRFPILVAGPPGMQIPTSLRPPVSAAANFQSRMPSYGDTQQHRDFSGDSGIPVSGHAFATENSYRDSENVLKRSTTQNSDHTSPESEAAKRVKFESEQKNES